MFFSSQVKNSLLISFSICSLKFSLVCPATSHGSNKSPASNFHKIFDVSIKYLKTKKNEELGFFSNNQLKIFH